MSDATYQKQQNDVMRRVVETGSRHRQDPVQHLGRNARCYGGLQQRTAEVYAGLAARAWFGPWTVIGADARADGLVADLLS